MNRTRLLGLLVATICPITYANAASLPFEERLDGLAYYDPNLQITWTTDTHIESSSLSWAEANAWAESLEVGGVEGWRLPDVDVNGDGVVANCSNPIPAEDCADNEFGFLYWEEGVRPANPGPFENLQGGQYWSSSESDGIHAPPNKAWFFSFSGGANTSTKDTRLFVWAVHDGDVAAVPIPAAIWLFGSGMIGLVALGKRPARH